VPETIRVPLLDLKAQYQAIKDEVDRAIHEVLDSQYFILGPTVEQLEKDIAAYCDVKHAIGCASGSEAAGSRADVPLPRCTTSSW
jgi:dTDP-4-amino-4,6-dideoxygalactose transaminase